MFLISTYQKGDVPRWAAYILSTNKTPAIGAMRGMAQATPFESYLMLWDEKDLTKPVAWMSTPNGPIYPPEAAASMGDPYFGILRNFKPRHLGAFLKR